MLLPHVYGQVEFFEDRDRLHQAVSRLTDLYEQARAKPWAITDAPGSYTESQLKGIVGLRFSITRFEGKRKMSQNQPEQNRTGVAAGLAASDRNDDRTVATMIPTGPK